MGDLLDFSQPYQPVPLPTKATETIVPRDYQAAALAASQAAKQQGIQQQVIVIGVGGGKTILIAKTVEEQLAQLPEHGILIITHRHELSEQGREKILALMPKLSPFIGLEKAKSTCGPHHKIMMGSLQTVGKDIRRISRWRPFERISTIIFDEVHHLPGSSYARNIMQAVMQANPKVFVLGLTATPNRADGVPLTEFFQEEVYRKTTIDLILEKYLVPFRAKTVQTRIDIGNVKLVGEEFDEEELARRLNVDERNEAAVQLYRKQHAADNALVFCLNVEHTEAMTRLFQKHGVKAASITQHTSSRDRNRYIGEFKAGIIKVLNNCSVLTEGFDAPITKVLFILRPIRSPVLIEQILGRGDRPILKQGIPDWEAKPYCTVYDFVDLNAAHRGVQTVGRFFGLNPEFRFEFESPLDIRQQLQAQDEVQQVMAQEATSSQEITHILNDFDILKKLRALSNPKEPHYDWIAIQGEAWLILSRGEILKIVPDAIGRYHIHVPVLRMHLRIKGATPTPAVSIIAQADTLAHAKREAEKIIFGFVPQDKELLHKNATWRVRGAQEQATPAQISKLAGWGIQPPDNVTKAEASILISNYSILREIRRQQGTAPI